MTLENYDNIMSTARAEPHSVWMVEVFCKFRVSRCR
jgi:hypothetical protein